MAEEGELLIFVGGSGDGKSLRHRWLVPGDPGNNRIAIPKWTEGNIEPQYYRRITGTSVFQWEGDPAVEPDHFIESR